MTQKEYKEEHIPHRINLLITYKKRFENLFPSPQRLLARLLCKLWDVEVMFITKAQ